MCGGTCSYSVCCFLPCVHCEDSLAHTVPLEEAASGLGKTGGRGEGNRTTPCYIQYTQLVNR